MDRRAHMKKLYSGLTSEQLISELRWRRQRQWTNHMISGADCMIVPNIRAICLEILRERGVDVKEL